MIEGTLTIETDTGERTVALASYLDAAAEDEAHVAARQWIKALRRMTVGGETFRDRFRVRGDSLWWFSEIYLHKQRAILDIHRALTAAEALIERERPVGATAVEGSAAVRHVVALALARAGTPVGAAAPGEHEWATRLTKLKWRARGLNLAALASRVKVTQAPEVPPGAVAAFIHRAFWRSGGEDGSAESYIGPVLQALEQETGPAGVRYVGVGPAVNFRARRWWKPVEDAARALVPVERYATWSALRASRAVWWKRHAHVDELSGSEALRSAAVIRGIDCWPIVQEQLAGIAWLQWPWSARAMDEAGAALDALQPAAVLTYAEAGGWGRALMLEARRRRIPSVGLQHGFIYRHWLNYLHEPDEVDPSHPDGGFPAPDATLLFDEFAASHLRTHGRFAPAALRVTGSPRLDTLLRDIAAATPERVRAAREASGAQPDEALVLVVTKEREARQVLPRLAEAAAKAQRVRLVIKPHPAETADVYGSVASLPHVSVLAAATPLPDLLAACRAVVTVNSTLALDAAVAGIPALAVGLPNNLSPFVDAGVIAGASERDIEAQLQRILYDEGFRQQLSDARSAFLGQHAIASDGGAAGRSARAVIALARSRQSKDAD